MIGKTFLACAALLSLGTSLLADTLILKDGRKLEWTAMTDKGEELELQLDNGTKLSVKKTEVDRVIFGKAPEALTGADFVFDKKRKLEVFDILSKVDPLKALDGSANSQRGVLTISAGAAARAKFPTSFTPPTEYDLTVVAERQGPIGEFTVGIVVGGKQVPISFDAYKNSASGVMWYESKGLIDNPDAYKKPVFGKGPRTFTFMVRKEGLIVRVDQEAVVAIAAQNFHRFTDHPHMGVPDKTVILFSCLEGTFKVTRALLSTPKQQP